MPQLKKIFTAGRMSKDADERLLPQGEYRHAENVHVIGSDTSENSGTVKNVLSTKKLTNFAFTGTVYNITPSPLVYQAKNKIYWLCKDDVGCYLLEYDIDNQALTPLLIDTRPLATRVLNLKKEFPCTALNIVTHEDPKKELILLTENNLEPLCINIERAKTYGTNGFDEEDILLIKKPPRFAPKVMPTYINGASNYLEEKFISVSYSYKYLDGEYSAASSYTNYIFYPSAFKLDYSVLDNLGMLNIYNAIRLTFNTGDKRVTDIRVQVKFSNNNNLYVVETFNKENEQWDDNQEKSLVFANEKIYVALPEREQFRSFDNVPRKALAQTLIGNLAVYSNYLEGYSLKDVNGNPYKSNFDLSVVSSNLDGTEVPTIRLETVIGLKTYFLKLNINLTSIALKKGSSLTIYVSLINDQATSQIYSQSFQFLLNKDFANASELAQDDDFKFFVENYMTNLFLSNYTISPIANSDLDSNTSFEIESFTLNTITIKSPELTFVIGGDPLNTVKVLWNFRENTKAYFYSIGSITSLKSNRSTEVSLVYMDKFGRKTTPLTQLQNSVYIDPSLSDWKNRLKININHNPPAFADRFKIAIKQQKLAYQTIYATIFYTDGLFRWIKLENDNYDKVKLGDNLIIKRDTNGVVDDLVKVKVLEIASKEKNFIEGNFKEDGITELIELAGNYMKIKLPTLANMDYTEGAFKQFPGYAKNSGDDFYVFIGPFDNDEGTDKAIKQGSRIDINLLNTKFGSNGGRAEFNKTYFASIDYPNFKSFYDNEVSNQTGEFSHPSNGMVRGDLAIVNTFNDVINVFAPNPSGKLYLKIHNELNGNGQRASRLYGTVDLIDNNGLIIFETEEEKSIDTEIFYETEQTFEIVNGLHQGDINQTLTSPAEITLEYFNCFCFGNGAESYIIKDAFNENYLNVDLRPSAVSVEEYDEVVRSCDLTYSEPFNESSNINGLNVFNLSMANFKDDIDKQYGSTQKIYARENDVLVLQKEKAGKVLFNKNAIYTADGNPSITSIPEILGQYIPYRGNRGIGNNRESFSVDDDGRIKYASGINGTIVRLSLDGIEDITYGFKSFFRDLFINQPNAKVISGYDPFSDQTVFSVGNEPERIPLFQCSNQIIKSEQNSEFKYNLQLNSLGGDIVFNYNITSGSADITIEFNSNTDVVSGVIGTGTITVERNTLAVSIATITITPITRSVSYTIDNICPIGSELEIVMVVINDENDKNKTIINRFRTLGNSFVSTEDLFLNPPITRFESIVGLEGVGSFPSSGSIINIQAQKNSSNNGKFEIDKCNRMGFLVSSAVYNEVSYLSLLNNIDTEFITVTESGEDDFSINWSGNFVFNRSSPTEKLYLIWDYTTRKPNLPITVSYIPENSSITISVIDTSDPIFENATVEIINVPLFGTAVVNADQKIEYTRFGVGFEDDEIVYRVVNGSCSTQSLIEIRISLTACKKASITIEQSDIDDADDGIVTLLYASCAGFPKTKLYEIAGVYEVCVNSDSMPLLYITRGGEEGQSDIDSFATITSDFCS